MNLKESPAAYADIQGNKNYPNLKGKVYFYDTYGGTMVAVTVRGITDGNGKNSQNFHGFHIHAGKECTGNGEEPFMNVDGHYNPENTEHPQHAGDLPPLLSNNGVAWMSVYTDRFYPEDIIGKTVIIHAMADDFHTQPSGNSGEMIACGEIKEWDEKNRNA